MHDLINQCQVITSSMETGHRERCQQAIDKVRKLLEALEVLGGVEHDKRKQQQRAS